MKRIVSIILSVVFIMSLSVIASAENSSDVLYVSPLGDDSASGSIENPLATFEGAKEKAKQLRGNVTVYFREGTYTFEKNVSFNSADKQNVLYKAYNGEKVVFTAGTPYTDFEECSVNGVKAFKKYVGKDAEISTLFTEKMMLKKTRYPESGYLYPTAVKDKYRLDPDAPKSENGTFTAYAAMDVNPSSLPELKNSEYVVARILHFWKDELLPLKSYNPSTGHMEFSKGTSMRVDTTDRFFLENVFEALNDTHEWYFDKPEGMLYYIPDDGENADTLTLWGGSLETFIRVSGVDGISFENIIFRGNGYTVKSDIDFSQAAYDAKPCLFYEDTHDFYVRNCEFRDLASCAVFMGSVVSESSVENCIFSNIGAQAVYIRGENVPADSPRITKNITVKNNIISGYGRVFFNAVGILVIHANSVDILNNEIHDGYYTAISVGWVWGYSYSVTYNNKICDNLIYNIGQGWLSDMGGIYTLGNQPGTVISGNVIHNVAADPNEGGYGGWGIYLDEGSAYILVEKNLAYCCGNDCFHLHYGSYNTVRNNIFALSGESQVRVVSSAKRSVAQDGGKKVADFYRNILLTDKNVRAFSCLQDKASYTADGNFYWDMTCGDTIYVSKDTDEKNSLSLETAERKKLLSGSVVADPCFKDAAGFDFELDDNSPVIAADFEKWDISRAGTLKDTVIGLDTQGGKTAYNAESRSVEMKPAKERWHFFRVIWNRICCFFTRKK